MDTEKENNEEEIEREEAISEAEEGSEAAETDDEEGEGSYKIGDQSFASFKEAQAYAESLVYKNAITEAESNAYRQAVADTQRTHAQGDKVTHDPETERLEFEQKYYEDPHAYMKEFEQKITEKVESRTLGKLQQQNDDERLWGEFFNKHTDLKDFREDCEYVLAKHTSELKAIVSTKGQQAGMDFLAQKTRAKFQAYHEGSKPSRELYRTTSGPSHGSPDNVTQKKAPEAKLDFASELRSLRGKRA